MISFKIRVFFFFNRAIYMSKWKGLVEFGLILYYSMQHKKVISDMGVGRLFTNS